MPGAALDTYFSSSSAGVPSPAFLPPVAPSRNADEIAQLFLDNTNGIRIGMVLVMWAAGVFIFFAAAIGQFLSK